MKVAIVGIGLIGGSIALCLKKKYGEDVRITACDRQSSNIQLARSLGVIDEGFTDLEEALEGADFVFLCTPVQSLIEVMPLIMTSEKLKKGAIVTDVGSAKSSVVRLSEQLNGSSAGIFIGGHPMAGSHKSGVEAAHERLFENAFYVLTPSEKTDDHSLSSLTELLSATKAHIVHMDAAEHDRVVGAISHFPHLIASALVEQVHDYHGDNELPMRLAAGGFRDITRIASANPIMWRDIVLHNRDALLEQLEDWKKYMERLQLLVASGDGERIENFFVHAKQVRDGLPERKKGAIPSFYDLYVDVPDHPGVIGQVTTLLGIHEISIINIAILEMREDIMGVLRLSFRNEEDMEEARRVLGDAKFPVYHRD